MVRHRISGMVDEEVARYVYAIHEARLEEARKKGVVIDFNPRKRGRYRYESP